MTASSLHQPGFHALLFVLLWSVSWGHDLTASHGLVRVKSGEIVVQIKIATDTAWPLVQEMEPGAVFLSEKFETEGRPLLLKFAPTLSELTCNEKLLSPIRTDVALAEDVFLFVFVYSLPPPGILRIKEAYLPKMFPGYVSRFRVFDSRGRLVKMKTLSAADPSFELALPLENEVPETKATPQAILPTEHTEHTEE